jgi:hypothetical protein
MCSRRINRAAAVLLVCAEEHWLSGTVEGSVGVACVHAVGVVSAQHMHICSNKHHDTRWPVCAGENAATASVLHRMEAASRRLDEVRAAADQPIIDSWSCLKEFVAAYQEHCGKLTSYAARHTRWMATLCNSGVQASTWRSALASSCVTPLQPTPASL